jgi:hypothetical protein
LIGDSDCDDSLAIDKEDTRFNRLTLNWQDFSSDESLGAIRECGAF